MSLFWIYGMTPAILAKTRNNLSGNWLKWASHLLYDASIACLARQLTTFGNRASECSWMKGMHWNSNKSSHCRLPCWCFNTPAGSCLSVMCTRICCVCLLLFTSTYSVFVYLFLHQKQLLQRWGKALIVCKYMKITVTHNSVRISPMQIMFAKQAWLIFKPRSHPHKLSILLTTLNEHTNHCHIPQPH